MKIINNKVLALVCLLSVFITAYATIISTPDTSSKNNKLNTELYIASVATEIKANDNDQTSLDIQVAPLTEFADNLPDQLQNSFALISDNRPIIKPKKVLVHSLDSIKHLFDSIHYNSHSWQQGNREVPRLTFETVTEQWQKNAHNIPVDEKKMIFFRLMAPLILLSNEKMLLERRYIEISANDNDKVLQLAQKYKVIDSTELKNTTTLTDEQKTTLLNRVDIVPPSLVLAQAAEESGWATSRFTVEGNAFFGQWDFSGNGMMPKQQRTELGHYGIARFDSPLESVIGYLININTHDAYQKLRNLRANLRLNNEPITGLELAGTLDKYSERGQAYIDSLRSMIRYNQLEQVDEAYLSDDNPIHLITGNL
ncbi:glucosaminidase domain-containing protein [Shewanella sp. OMA3-2]|uniref:glucosaminidase domain-containing protein n=1 Tax=Shewanella sp. OMA3-2 TaxID=2908650 RepID=UPI001F170B7D|nr:glucosaminidase domain-containing protein [Shewanella sp. OMA3-2]UJF21484.1 glucosaminidase domain-containing protein [Shewanella sp. OMA3-2]